MKESSNEDKRTVEIKAVYLGKKNNLMGAIKFYLTHLIEMIFLVILSSLAIVIGMILFEILVDFLLGTSPGTTIDNIFNILSNNIVIIITAIYCGILYHYMYKIKGLKSIFYLFVGIVTILICLLMNKLIGGIIALIIPSLLTIRKNENDIVELKDNLSEYTLEIKCPKCGSNMTMFHNSEKYELLKVFIYSILIILLGYYQLLNLDTFFDKIFFIIFWGLGFIGIVVIILARLGFLTIKGKLNYHCFSCEETWDIRENNNI